VSKTLKGIQELLKNRGFVRVHHAHLINVHYVLKYVRSGGGYIEFENGTVVGVSRNRKNELLTLLDQMRVVD